MPSALTTRPLCWSNLHFPVLGLEVSLSLPHIPMSTWKVRGLWLGVCAVKSGRMSTPPGMGGANINIRYLCDRVRCVTGLQHLAHSFSLRQQLVYGEAADALCWPHCRRVQAFNASKHFIRPKKLLCFRLQSGEKVGTWENIFYFMTCRVMLHNSLSKQIDTSNSTHEN